MRHNMNLRDDALMIQSRGLDIEPTRTTQGMPRKRLETDSDAEFVLFLYESVKVAEMATFDAGVRSQLLRMQFSAMTGGYRATFPAADYYIIEVDDHPIGRLILNVKSTLVQVIYIALLPQFRNRGFGEAIMREALNVSPCCGAVCEATVAQGNTASLRLWKKLGFTRHTETATDILMQRRPA